MKEALQAIALALILSPFLAIGMTLIDAAIWQRAAATLALSSGIFIWAVSGDTDHRK